MSFLKRTGLILVLAILGLVDVSIYWNRHLYYRAVEEGDPARKAALLETANACFPLNDLAFYELGKVYGELGIGGLNDPAAAASYLRRSVENLKESVRLNPASPFAHFHLAQSLLNLELVDPGKSELFYDEFRKAAELAGEDSQLFYEVGRLFLSRWPELSGQDRDFTLEILKKFLAGRDKEKVALILNTWELNARDYLIIEKILPADAPVYRQYGQFLGEKSLSLDERHKYLARAELLDFGRAKDEFQSGRECLAGLRVHEASTHFERALNLLREIRFYTPAPGERSVVRAEFSELVKSLYLERAKCFIEEEAGLKRAGDYLRQYLELEDQTAALGALENYLKDRRVIPRRVDPSSTDLDRLVLEVTLMSKLGRYDEIKEISRLFERPVLVVPEAVKRNYVRIFQIIGDSYQKTGNLEEALGFYQSALEIAPADLETLLRLRPAYSRLNDRKKLEELNAQIDQVLTPPAVGYEGLQLEKAHAWRRPLVLDGRNIVLDVRFDSRGGAAAPLVSIFLNDRVVWDEYSPDGHVSVLLETKAGRNVFQITPVNCPISAVRLSYLTVGGS